MQSLVGTVIGARRDELRQAAVAHALRSRDADACPCSSTALCDPIGGAPVRSREIFGFGGGNGSAIDWTRVTTVAWAADDRLMCDAHAAGARVIMAAPKPQLALTSNRSARAIWVADAVRRVRFNWLDGIVFDWEEPCEAGAPSQHHYALLMRETRQALRAISRSYQVTVCVAWSPDTIDGRGYDVRAFAASTDLVYVMDYDTRSQIYDACIAAANAPYGGTLLGLRRYAELGIPAGQLILGVPWYGYRYRCLAGTGGGDRFCSIEATPFRGANCSDAVGVQLPYWKMLEQLHCCSATGRRWDESQAAPWFNVFAGGTVLQYWYDDPQSLRLKYASARRQGLRGVGPYTFTDADGKGGMMYQAFDAFLLPGGAHVDVVNSAATA
tara:strand:+ start:62 stop:1213 length:1152 start_codon:yes stop_codon:yes gene_type:complete